MRVADITADGLKSVGLLAVVCEGAVFFANLAPIFFDLDAAVNTSFNVD